MAHGTNQSPIDFYALLGVLPSATLDEIKTAYRSGIAHYHPDRNRSPHANAVTALLNEAWEVLGHSERRHRHDAAAALDSRRRKRAADQTAAPSTVWLVKHFNDRTVWSAWSSETQAVLAARRYRQSASPPALFEVAPLVIDVDSYLRPAGERTVDDLTIRSLQALAETGDVFAQLTLAHHYQRGIGVRQDFRLAGKWFDQAERRGDVWEPSNVRRVLAKRMTRAQIAEAERWAQEWIEIFKLLPRD